MGSGTGSGLKSWQMCAGNGGWVSPLDPEGELQVEPLARVARRAQHLPMLAEGDDLGRRRDEVPEKDAVVGGIVLVQVAL